MSSDATAPAAGERSNDHADAAPLVLLLHGMDGIGAVWEGVIDALGPRWRVLAPDLPGHGDGTRLSRYHLEDFADALLERYGTELAQGPLVIAGHSVGGAIGLVLAGRHPSLSVRGVLALGCKTVWSDEELAGMARVAERPVGYFEDEVAAADRFVKVSGLVGLVSGRVARLGVRAEDGRWRLAVDPPAHRVPAPDFGALLDECDRLGRPLVLATGERDPMAPQVDLARFGRPVEIVADAGHNAHVEQPAAVAALIERLLPAEGS